LGSFIENNHNLAQFEVRNFVIGPEGGQKLASALGRMNHNSLTRLSMASTEISAEDLAEIANALRLQSQLKCLQLYRNNIGRDGCIALGNTLSRWPHSNKLETLSLGNNSIDDGGLQALVPGLMNCRSLKELYLGWNRSITAAGLRSLFPLLQSESHSMEKLHLNNFSFGDDGALVLAEGLRGNRFLKDLAFDVETAGITTIGWSAFSKMLCDTSTINKG
jgi:Ran GTPase-activating protein (RanGAP) involved in mRNA processing and transport